MPHLGRHIGSQHDGVINAEEERMGPPVFPQQHITDGDAIQTQENYSAIAADLFEHEPEALQKYFECAATIFDNRIVRSHNRRVSQCCDIKENKIKSSYTIIQI